MTATGGSATWQMSCGSSRRSEPARRHEPFLHRLGDSAAAAPDLELFVNPADMFVGGVVADFQRGGGLFDRLALHERLEDFLLARSEAVIAGGRIGLGKHLQH